MTWTPDGLDKELWLDAKDPATLTLDTSDNVTQWDDKSGKGRHAVGYNGGPWFITSDGYPGIYTNGKHFTIPSSTGTFAFMHQTGAEVYAVFTPSAQKAMHPVLGNTRTTLGVPGVLISVESRDVIPGADRSLSSVISRGAYNQPTASTFDPDGAGVYDQFDQVFEWNKTHSIAVTFQPDAAAAERILFSRSDEPDIKGNLQTYPISTSNAGHDLQIGAAGNNVRGGEMVLKEIIIFSTPLSADDRDKMFGYLAHKWGTTDDLPDDHPYKLVAPGAAPEQTQASKVSGVVQIDGTPAERNVRAFGYDPSIHDINGNTISLSKSLGHATSDPDTGEYTIDLLEGYSNRIFVVAFDDYGADFTSSMSVNVGDRVHPTTPNGYVWECTGAGALPAEEPAWVIDEDTSRLYGTASMITKPFYRPMVQGPIVPEIVVEQIPPHWRITITENNGSPDFAGAIAEFELYDKDGNKITPAALSGTPGDGSTYSVSKVIDGDPLTRWAVRLGDYPLPINLHFQTEPPVKIASYKIMPTHYVSSGDSYRSRTPRSWVIETSMDGINWTEVHAVSGVGTTEWSRETFNTYTIPQS